MRNMKAFDLLSGQQLDEWWNDLTQADSISRRLRARVTRGGLVGLAVAFLFMLPMGYLPSLGNLAHLNVILGWQALQALVILPLAVYVAVILPSAFQLIRHVILRRGNDVGQA